MTLEEYKYIIHNKLIGACTQEEIEQVYAIAFGEKFMEQDDKDKGNIQEIQTSKVSVHVNDKHVSSDTYDLDVFDRYTLEKAVQALAFKVNHWMKYQCPEKAMPYSKFKIRIKMHLQGK